MSNARTIKEKILAVLVVITLFIFAGTILGYVSLINKAETVKLQAEAIARKNEALMQSKVDSLEILGIESKTISARAYLSLAFSKSGYKKTLAQKNADISLPIASISKLMTAIIAVEKIDLETKVLATKEYVGGDGTAYIVEVGKTYTASELLNNTLISSDNDSARLLASILGEDNFISLMNTKAMELDMTHTFFVNNTGLDPLDNNPRINISSANDLVKMMVYINDKHPEIFQITRNALHNFCNTDQECKNIVNTNLFLTSPDFKFKIIGGKTGTTFLAGTNLVLIVEPFDDIFLVNIVLGSTDRFSDTEAIINQLNLQN